MEFDLNLIENSYDYIEETLSYYKEVGYIESHDEDRNSVEDKRKWKTTFILLVQAMELLLKEGLLKINSKLVYENIDEKITNKTKTISYSNAIIRLKNLKPKMFSQNEVDLLISCGEVRNNFIHFKVSINTIEIKKKYCKFFELYKKIHYKVFHKSYKNEKYKYIIDNIIKNAKNLEVFRGIEFTRSQLKLFKKELAENQNNSYIIMEKKAYSRLTIKSQDFFEKIL